SPVRACAARSALLAAESPVALPLASRGCASEFLSAAACERFRSRNRNGFEDAADDLVAGDFFGLRFVGPQHSVTQYIRRDRFHIVRSHERPSAQERVRARALRQCQCRARTRAELDQRLELSETRL